MVGMYQWNVCFFGDIYGGIWFYLFCVLFYVNTVNRFCFKGKSEEKNHFFIYPSLSFLWFLLSLRSATTKNRNNNFIVLSCVSKDNLGLAPNRTNKAVEGKSVIQFGEEDEKAPNRQWLCQQNTNFQVIFLAGWWENIFASVHFFLLFVIVFEHSSCLHKN